VESDSVFDTDGYWIDCRGRMGPNPVGIAIMAHPRFGEQPLFARPYGTLAHNPFMRQGRHLAPGEVFRRGYSVWAYDCPDGFDAAAAFNLFVNTAVGVS
jgi:hypothetical protein